MSFASIISILSFLPSLFGIVDAAVMSVENSLGNVPGISGSQKLVAATTKINAVLGAAGTDVAAFSVIEKVLTPMINAAVVVFNDAGLFKKNAAAPAVAAV